MTDVDQHFDVSLMFAVSEEPAVAVSAAVGLPLLLFFFPLSFLSLQLLFSVFLNLILVCAFLSSRRLLLAGLFLFLCILFFWSTLIMTVLIGLPFFLLIHCFQ